ncbi:MULTISPECIES: DUF2946 family protein [unclassified Polynucleobacter]|uniref:DUF2946 family protein n=1 Tax=unclassified Polynucleobacter TaxID=2640945 RepID=UPI002574655B|nr:MULTISPECIES: DUF2946 family protein [unclassified Polynucleobacter]
MPFFHRKLTHWLTVLAFTWSVLMPSLAQAFGDPANHLVMMEICVADSPTKQVIDLETSEPLLAPMDCPYCVAQSAVLPSLLTNLQFAAPAASTLITNRDLGSPKTPFAWVKLPSQGPPQNTRI